MATLTIALACGGCGQPQATVPVEGILKIDGQPAANVSVQFMPDITQDSRGPTSFAVTDEEGRFRLQTYDGRDGAVQGHHRVVLADMDEERPAQGEVAQRPPRLGVEYSGQSSPLTVQIGADTGPLVLEAQSPRQRPPHRASQGSRE